MSRITKFLLGVLLLVIATGVVFLATWDIPAPSHQVEKVLDNERFPR